MTFDIATQATPPAGADDAAATIRQYCIAIRDNLGEVGAFGPLIETALTIFEKPVAALFAKASRLYGAAAKSAATGAISAIDEAAVTAAEARGNTAGSRLGTADGGGDPTAEEKRRLVLKVASALRAKVTSSLEAEAESVGSQVAEALAALATAMKKARATALLPPSMRRSGPTDLPTILMRQDRRRELVSQFRDDPQQMIGLYETMKALDPAKADEMRDLLRSDVEELASGRAKSLRPQMALDDTSSAQGLAGKFKQDDARDIPPEIGEASKALGRLRILATKVVGVDWSRAGGMSTDAFQTALQEGKLGRQALTFEVMPGWPARFLPGTGPRAVLDLPTWTPAPFTLKDNSAPAAGKAPQKR